MVQRVDKAKGVFCTVIHFFSFFLYDKTGNAHNCAILGSCLSPSRKISLAVTLLLTLFYENVSRFFCKSVLIF